MVNSTAACEQDNTALSALLFALSAKNSFADSEVCRAFKERIFEKRDGDLLRSLSAGVSGTLFRECCNEIEKAGQEGVRVVNMFQDGYPAPLREIADPPLVLFIRGEARFDIPAAAVVGTRSVSEYGRRTAFAVAQALTRAGMQVVSGLAFGVDEQAHRGAAAAAEAGAGFAGTAVLGSGVLNPVPATNRPVASRLLDAGGVLISEYGLFSQARRYFFPRRNRIISGLAAAVIVVEAGERSGSLITARFALSQGRDVYAVPGPIDSPGSRGTNLILSQGAFVVTTVEELLALLGLPSASPGEDAGGSSTDSFLKAAFEGEELRIARRVLRILRIEGRAGIDQLSTEAAAPLSTLARILTSLEVSGILEATPDQAFRLAGAAAKP